MVGLQAPVGGEEASVVVEEVGSRPQHAFTTQDHMQLSAALGLLDFEAAAVTSGETTLEVKCTRAGPFPAPL